MSESNQLLSAMIRVIGEVIIMKQGKTSKKMKREWVKKWVQRRQCLGISNTLLNELAVEDPKCFQNFLRMNEDMFNMLLEKVCIFLSYYFIEDSAGRILYIFYICNLNICNTMGHNKNL